VEDGTTGTPGDSPDAHGTCVASIACSVRGIMIRGTVVAVKVRRRVWDFVVGVAMAINDIFNKQRQGKSVINISLGKSIVYEMTFVHTNLLYSYLVLYQ
jgi:hypothetical protein